MIEINDLYLNRILLCNNLKNIKNIICICNTKEEKQLDNLNPEEKYVVYFDYQDYCNKKLIKKIILWKNIVKIFATNLNVKDPKCVFVPLGLGLWCFNFSGIEITSEIKFKTDGVEKKYKNYNFIKFQKYLMYIQKKIPLKDKKKIISLDFKNGMEKKGNKYVLNFRKKCFEIFLNKKNEFESKNYKFYYEENKVSVKKIWDLYSEIQFVVSPNGNGVDCHRTYEALVLGAIVIIEKNNTNWVGYKALSNLFGKQIIIVENYNDLTPEYLDQYIVEYQDSIKYNQEKLYSNYWINLIKNSL